MRDRWAWLRGWWDSGDRTKDVKLLAFAAVVGAALVWLSREQVSRGITPAWVDAFMWLCGLVGVGGSAWAAVEKWGDKRAQNQPQTKGAKDEGEP